MSDKLMDTSPGGESTQYESIKTVTEPHAKDGGQFGAPETKAATSNQTDAEKAERGERTAANIRYGQAISEEGMAGMTTEDSSSAQQGGAYGRQPAEFEGDSDSAAKDRAAGGYGGQQDQDRNIGA